MNISLLNYTGMGCDEKVAPAILIFTKNTRLEMKANAFSEVLKMPWAEIQEELEYMSNTIPSSWEFIDYTFVIEGVTRAFTHQFVRNRTGSYAQQTMRVLNVSGFEYLAGPSIKKDATLEKCYQNQMAAINDMYSFLIDNGAQIQDARGVLPTNIKTNIVAKFNLRTVAEIAAKRASPRTQGEYRDVLDKMISAVLEVHPWAELFLRNKKIDAAKRLDTFIKEVYEKHPMSADYKTNLLKAVDLLRQ